ncbi:hypothetical protein J4573_12145 [Actinomadura barringtoniae]|uniref:MaoC-like domain-containing protein n=1 Tax=Actinomadura barringtoniae TaxID=1427535 RepID=A0A939P8M2_9ACTN|nr:MaoC/PaaZ C-terminal domain-containing protein [Actinomadura barringtoniae]MBO2447845.1 hypothetical protein [Actinomadura barringtoniae]
MSVAARSVTVGEGPPVLERRIDLPDMIAYAGATWDWHRLHYDPEYVNARGLPGPVVDGQVFGALLAEQIQDWLGPRARLRRLHFRFRNPVFAGETVRCTGAVSKIDIGGLIVVEQRVEVPADGRVAVAPAGATVEFGP